MAERAQSHMGGGKKKSSGKSKKKSGKVHVMHIKRAGNGGYIATHDYEPPEDGMSMAPKSEDHIHPDLDSLKAGLDEHMGEQPEEQEPAPQPRQGMMAGAPGGMPA